MILNNIVLTVLFCIVIIVCTGFAFICVIAGKKSGSAMKMAVELVDCVALAVVGIIGVWISGTWSWLMWLYLVALLYLIHWLYKRAVNSA